MSVRMEFTKMAVQSVVNGRSVTFVIDDSVMCGWRGRWVYDDTGKSVENIIVRLWRRLRHW